MNLKRLMTGVFLVIFAIFFGSCSTVLATEKQKPRVAVIVMDNRIGSQYGYWTDWGSNTPLEDIRQIADSVLGQSGYFQVCSREMRQETWNEQDLISTGRMNPETVAQISQTTGAEFFLIIYVRYFKFSSAGAVAVPFQINGKGYGIVHGWANTKLVLAAKLLNVATSTVTWPAGGDSTIFEGLEKSSINAIGSEYGAIGWGSSPAGKATQQAVEKIRDALVREFIPSYQPTKPLDYSSPPDLSELQKQALALPAASGEILLWFTMERIVMPGWRILLNKGQAAALVDILSVTIKDGKQSCQAKLLKGKASSGMRFDWSEPFNK